VRALLLLVSAVILVDSVFYAAITPLLPAYADEFDLSKTGAGVLAASYAAGTLVASVPAGLLAARVGVRPTVVLGLGLMTVSCLAFAFAPSIVVLDVARFAQGVGGAASWAGAFAWLAGAAPPDRRGEMVGSAMAAAIVGALFGPLLGGIAAGIGTEPTFSIVAGLGAGMIVWTLRTPASRPETPGSLRDLFTAVREARVVVGMWLMAMPGLLFGTIGVLAPLRLDDLGAGAGAIAAAFLLAAILEAVVSPLVGRASDRHGRVLPALIGLGATAVVMACLPWPGDAWLLGLLIVLAAPSIGTLWAPAMAMLSDGAEALGIEQGLVFGLMNLAWATGQASGSSLSARLAEAAGDEVPYLGLALVCLASLAALGLAMKRRRRVAAA
jgi:MFS family permease